MISVIPLADGLGREQLKRSDDAVTLLRSGQVVLGHPGLVQAVHAEYSAAGVAAKITDAQDPDILIGTGQAAQFNTRFNLTVTEAQTARQAPGCGQDKSAVDALSAWRNLGPAAYSDFALGWINQRATIVCGRCEVGPDNSAVLARRLTASGHTLAAA